MDWTELFETVLGWWGLVTVLSLLPLGLIDIWTSSSFSRRIDNMWSSWLLLGVGGTIMFAGLWFISWLFYL